MLYPTWLFVVKDAYVCSSNPLLGISTVCNMFGLDIETIINVLIEHPLTLNAFGWVPFKLNPHNHQA